MKKQNVLNLIKYWAQKNEFQFRNEAIDIARSFDKAGDYQLSEYIIGLLATGNTFVPQEIVFESRFLRKTESESEPLPLPEGITTDIKGIINAVGHQAGINKFLFEGAPGTGKTESVKQIARILNRNLYVVEFSELIDSKLGQTAKNIVTAFREINSMPNPHTALILFDEIDAIALDRININDLREMGRVTSTVLKELDSLNEEVVLIATTNLFEQIDRALIRRFDGIINFNRYSREDYVEIGQIMLNTFLKKFKHAGRDMKLFKKIIRSMEKIASPAELKNSIKIALAFSDPSNELDYLRRLLDDDGLLNENEEKIKNLSQKGFTVREIEILTGVSKSQVARILK